MKKNALPKAKKRYLERGASIYVPNDGFFDDLRRSLRLNDPDTSSDKLLLEKAATRLQKLLGCDGKVNVDEALKKITQVQERLNRSLTGAGSSWLKSEDLLFLHLNRLMIGLVGYSAIDRDLAKLFRCLQENAKLTDLSKRRITEIRAFSDVLHTRFSWRVGFLSDEFREKISRSHPYSALDSGSNLSVAINFAFEEAVSLIKLAATERWDTTAIEMYGPVGRVPRPLFNKCFTLLEKVRSKLGLSNDLVLDIFGNLGVAIPEAGPTYNTKVGINEPASSPITEELKLRLAIAVCSILGSK